MPNPSLPVRSPGISLGDIYYVLFRHKWKIILCSILGFVAAVAVFKFKPPPYESEANLILRYVIDSKTLAPPSDDTVTTKVDPRGDMIINTELQILTSFDLAQQVATAIGPEKLLVKLPPGTTPEQNIDKAAYLISANLKVNAPINTNAIHLSFWHSNKDLVQPVLKELINAYGKKHVQIHREGGIMAESVTQETDNLRLRLAQTEEELRKAKSKTGVISIDDAKKAYTEQIVKIQGEIRDAQAEYAERKSVLDEINKRTPGEVPATDNTPEPTADQISHYHNVSARLEGLQKREQELLVHFREGSVSVKQVQEQIAEVTAVKKKLEEETPKLTRAALVATNPAAPMATTGPIDPAAEAARLAALEVRINVLTSQLADVRADADKIIQMEGTISDLQRKMHLEETNYQYYSSSLEASRIDDAMGKDSVSNIATIQAPTPPLRDWGKVLKLMAGVGFAGVGGGLAWAFLVEFYLDRTIKRPIDVERMARLPLFLSIPNLTRKETRRLTAAADDRLALPGSGKAEGAGAAANGSLPLAKLDTVNLLHPFHETLRDRLISYFESKGLTHKPKLVAVTGIGRNSGVTTTAAGLAGTLSETGEGNVLLVDMTVGQGSAQQFYKGNAVCGLEEILDTRNQAQIQDNLFVVGEGKDGEQLSRMLPQRFSKLIPKLKASDFDYIIFDMPPVSQLSITPRLAGLMDMVLLVVESEKTDRDLVQRATAMLAESKAHVGTVLNKTKTYVPPRLHQESLGNL